MRKILNRRNRETRLDKCFLTCWPWGHLEKVIEANQPIATNKTGRAQNTRTNFYRPHSHNVRLTHPASVKACLMSAWFLLEKWIENRIDWVVGLRASDRRPFFPNRRINAAANNRIKDPSIEWVRWSQQRFRWFSKNLNAQRSKVEQRRSLWMRAKKEEKSCRIGTWRTPYRPYG